MNDQRTIHINPRIYIAIVCMTGWNENEKGGREREREDERKTKKKG